MARHDPGRDPRLSAARYRVGSSGGRDPEEQDDALGPADPADSPSPEHRSLYVQVAIEQAERRGDFDGLPGAGRPIADLGRPHDPDWWIRQKIEREQITGLGPPALTLRTENRELDGRLDALTSERAVRELLDDFNRRVIDARRQLQGGPPVVTPTRDIESEVSGWRERRAERQRAAQALRDREAAERRASTWRSRWRRARRDGDR